jgi:hypothetical protein
MSTLDWEFLKQAAEFVGMDRKMKLCLLAGAVGAEASDDEKEMARAIGAKISQKKPDWKDAIRQCGIDESDWLDCCLASDDPAHCNNWPLRWAADRGYIDLVRILFQNPRVDPIQGGQNALVMAAKNGHIDVAKLLLQDSRVDLDAAVAQAQMWHCNDTVASLKKLQE